MKYNYEMNGQTVTNENCCNVIGYEITQILKVVNPDEYSDLLYCNDSKRKLSRLFIEGIYPEIKLKMIEDDSRLNKEYNYNFLLGGENIGKREGIHSFSWNSFAL